MIERTVINAATGEQIYKGHIEAVAFWYEQHAEWRLPRDESEVLPELRESFKRAVALYGDPLYVINATA